MQHRWPCNIVFKIDTGADVNTIPETLCHKDQFPRLNRPKRALQGPGGTFQKVKGRFTATLIKNGKSTTEDIYVVEGLCTPLQGGWVAVALQLVTRVNYLTLDSKDAVKQEFPKLFGGLR